MINTKCFFQRFGGASLISTDKINFSDGKVDISVSSVSTWLPSSDLKAPKIPIIDV